MSKNPNVEKAALLVANGYIHRGLAWVSIAEALDAAGLLVTPLHQRALEACKKWANGTTLPSEAWSDVAAIGREAIALEEAKKPKERWEVKCADDARTQWFVVGNGDFPTKGSCNQLLGPLYEPQARAVAKALNECDK